MGNCSSARSVKNEENRALETDEKDTVVRVVHKRHSKGTKELRMMLEADRIKPKVGGKWYIVETVWVRKWLAYACSVKGAKRPGPIRNSNLLRYDQETGEWKPKPVLRSAGRTNAGHFRRVCREVWLQWVHLYPKSGPEIWVSEPPLDKPDNWHVVGHVLRSDPNYPREGMKRKVRGLENAAEASNMVSGDGLERPELEVGEMEDDGVGDQNLDKLEAFFDNPLPPNGVIRIEDKWQKEKSQAWLMGVAQNQME